LRRRAERKTLTPRPLSQEERGGSVILAEAGIQAILHVRIAGILTYVGGAVALNDTPRLEPA